MKVKNMYSPNGNKVANQFVITTENSEVFQSYNTIIAIKYNDGTVELDTAWECTRTTSKYRNIFLGETTKETQKHIKSGEYQVTNLNN